MKKLSKKQLAIYIAILMIGILLILLGGGSLLLYFSLIGFSFYAGFKARGVVQLVRDYRLGLKYNSLAFSQKQYEKIVKENENLKRELSSASERLNIINATGQ